MPSLLSGRQPVVPSAKLTTTRYQYVSLAEAQPSLGTPAINDSILIGKTDGTTAWVPQSSIVSTTLPTENVVFVSKNGSDSNSGSSIGAPKQSIRSALSVASSGTTIVVFSGTYLENNPLVIPQNVTIIGQENNVIVIPQTTTADVFYLTSGSTAVGITVKNHKAPSYAFSITDGSNVSVPPLIKDCTSITGPFLNDGTLFVPFSTIQNIAIQPGPMPLMNTQVSDVTKRVNITAAGGGIHIDGLSLSELSLINHVTVENFTAINQGGIGILAENNVTVNVESSTTKFCSIGFNADTGATINLNSCTTEYGTYGLVSDSFYQIPYMVDGVVTESLFSSINSIAISEPGSGYLDPPTISFGTIWQASINAPLNKQYYYGNNLYIVTSPGIFGITAPTHNADSASNGGATLLWTGTVATAFATVTDGGVTDITITNNGTGYTEIPTVVFTGASITSATAGVGMNGIPAITINSISQPIDSTLIEVGNTPGKYTITDASPLVGTTSLVKLNPYLYYVLQGSLVNFYYDSIINANGHSFKFVGAGVTYNALTSNGGVPNPNNDILEVNYGKIYYSSMNERGLYKIGDVFSIDLITNAITLNANEFNLSNLGAIGPLIRDGVPSGVQMKEISNNTNLIASNGFIDSFTVPTQYAVSTYLQSNYLPLTGGGNVTGLVYINDLGFYGNTISSSSLNENIILSPNGTGKIDVATSKIINLVDPTSAQDAATKKYVDDALNGQQTYPTFNIGDFLIQSDTISNTILNGDMVLSTTGTGQVRITSTVDSTSPTTGALIVGGGVGIAKNLHVGTAVTAPTFYGGLSGTATQANLVMDAAQPNITSLGTLTSLQVDNVNINGSTIKNTLIDTNLKLGVTGVANVLPETTDTIGFGSIDNKWYAGWFINLNGTLQTANQPKVNGLAPVVSLYDASYALIPSLNVGYDSSNQLTISANHSSSHLTSASFTTKTTDINSGAITFYPNENLTLTVSNGLVTTANLYVNDILEVAVPIIKLGPQGRTTSIDHDTGIEYISNINISSSVTSVVITSDGATNTTVITLNDIVDTFGISTNDYIYLQGSFSPSTIQNYWAITSVIPGLTTFQIDIPLVLAAGIYTITPTRILLSKQGFFGYNQSMDAFTVITNVSITDNVVSGDMGTINAKLTSDQVNFTGGTIDDTVIGSTTPAHATFSMVSSNRYETTTTIESIGGDPIIVDSFLSSSADIAKYIIKIKDVDTGAITGQDLLIVQDGVNIYISEYGVEYTSDSLLGTFSANIDGDGMVNLILTPDGTNHTIVTLFRFYG